MHHQQKRSSIGTAVQAMAAEIQQLDLDQLTVEIINCRTKSLGDDHHRYCRHTTCSPRERFWLLLIINQKRPYAGYNPLRHLNYLLTSNDYLLISLHFVDGYYQVRLDSNGVPASSSLSYALLYYVLCTTRIFACQEYPMYILYFVIMCIARYIYYIYNRRTLCLD